METEGAAVERRRRGGEKGKGKRKKRRREGRIGEGAREENERGREGEEKRS